MPQTILVVDDEPQLVRALRGYLEQAGYRVATAGDGPAALAQYKHEKPDLVLLDLNLPGLDGLEVARRLRTLAEVPIIMVTARVEETDRLVGLELGADDYITKPFSPPSRSGPIWWPGSGPCCAGPRARAPRRRSCASRT